MKAMANRKVIPAAANIIGNPNCMLLIADSASPTNTAGLIVPYSLSSVGLQMCIPTLILNIIIRGCEL